MATVRKVVRSREYEPGRYDYKEVLVAARGDERSQEAHKLSIRKTVCAMANAQGGLILFGIRDRKIDVNSPENRIVGISLDRDLVKEFGDQVQHIEPELHFQATPSPIRFRDDRTRGVFVVSVEESPLRPHMVLPEHVYYLRGDGGQNVRMRHHEVRHQVQVTDERQRKMMLFQVKVGQFRLLTKVMEDMGDGVGRSFDRFDTATFDLLLADICGQIPSDELLETLMYVSLLARRLNRALDHAITPNYGYSHTGLMDAPQFKVDLNELRRQCTQCEGELTEHLGPSRILAVVPRAG